MIAKRQFIADIQTLLFRIDENRKKQDDDNDQLIRSEIKHLQNSTGDAFFPSMIEEFLYTPKRIDENRNEISSAAELWGYLKAKPKPEPFAYPNLENV